jgi:phosphatidate phosphatase APP1
MPSGDARTFSGNCQLVGEQGLLVVSDIDDTIKVTEVTDFEAMLENTFFREYRPVEGMATTYHRLSARGAAFCYVSNSPWQLYEPLAEFLDQHEFPKGSFHLRSFRVWDSSLVDFLKSPSPHKLESIRSLMERFPARRFILIGDSGESDPEIYAQVCRTQPGRVAGVFIRVVRGTDADRARLSSLAAGLPDVTWTSFDRPDELDAALGNILSDTQP